MRAGLSNFRFLVVGQGSEEPWLRANLKEVEFPGVLTRASLGRAYANMDAFVFPSRTDTYGNVVLEALASGVPAIVTDSGGPRFVIRQGENGFVAGDLAGFVSRVQCLIRNPAQVAAMLCPPRGTMSLSRPMPAMSEDFETGVLLARKFACGPRAGFAPAPRPRMKDKQWLYKIVGTVPEQREPFE